MGDNLPDAVHETIRTVIEDEIIRSPHRPTRDGKTAMGSIMTFSAGCDYRQGSAPAVLSAMTSVDRSQRPHGQVCARGPRQYGFHFNLDELPQADIQTGDLPTTKERLSQTLLIGERP